MLVNTLCFIGGMVVMDLLWAYRLGLLQAFVARIKKMVLPHSVKDDVEQS